MKKNMAFVRGVLAVAAALFFLARPGGAGGAARVDIAGGGTVRLALSQDGTYPIEGAALPVTLEVKDGAVRLVRKCGETAYDGTEEWHDYIATFDTVSHRLLHKDLAPALCTHGRYGGRYKGIFFGWASVDDIGFYPSRIGVDSVAGWKAWLAAQNTAGSPVGVVYVLKTPEITDITSTELGQVLLSMKSVQYYTRIYHNSALPVELEAAVTKLGRG